MELSRKAAISWGTGILLILASTVTFLTYPFEISNNAVITGKMKQQYYKDEAEQQLHKKKKIDLYRYNYWLKWNDGNSQKYYLLEGSRWTNADYDTERDKFWPGNRVKLKRSVIKGYSIEKLSK